MAQETRLKFRTEFKKNFEMETSIESLTRAQASFCLNLKFVKLFDV